MAIERKFVAQNVKEFRIKQYVGEQLSRVGLSSIKLQRTPLGDKILIRASRPGLVVGRAGSNIQKLTEALKTEFNLENPQIEIEEVQNFALDANIIAEMIANSLERFGSARFKGVGHKALQDVMNAGAMGVEILLSGKIPSQRAKTWRFYQGYLKKCGDVAVVWVDVAYKTAVLKTGVVGIKVSIMPPDTKLPDTILVKQPDPATLEEVTGAEAALLETGVQEGLDGLEGVDGVEGSAETGAGEAKGKARRKQGGADSDEKKSRAPRKKREAKTGEKKDEKKDDLKKDDAKKAENKGEKQEVSDEVAEDVAAAAGASVPSAPTGDAEPDAQEPDAQEPELSVQKTEN